MAPAIKYWKLYLTGVISIKMYWKLKALCKRKSVNRKTTFNRKRFQLNQFTDDEALLLFRFMKHEILQLFKYLNIPNTSKLNDRTSFTGIEALCILLRRLSYPNRLSDLVKTFNRNACAISKIFNWALKFVFSNHSHRLETLEQSWLTPARMDELAFSCKAAGSYYDNMIGFIDGTSRSICRPKYNQRIQYSGYKKVHCVKYQSIVYTNGLIGRLDGPFNGHRHDSAILHLSNVKNEMQRLFVHPRKTYLVYGDPGYSNQRFIKVGFKNYRQRQRSLAQKQFNSDMSALRVSVEYGFGKICQQFAFLDFKKNQKLYLQPLKEQYFVAALLVNCQTCLRGNQVSEYFNCSPPQLREYFQ